MTDINICILELIKQEKSNEDICRELNISKKQLKNRIESIKNRGININKKYKYNGTQNFFVDYNPQSIGTQIVTSIEDINKNEFKALAIADTHIGNINSNIRYIESIYSYCINNSISIVFHLGDILQGNKENELSMEQQIEYLIKKYPKYNNILTFLQLGNHDEDIIRYLGLNLSTLLNQTRDDIVPLGYTQSIVRIGKNNIYLSHENKFTNSYGLRIAGHSHRYKFNSHMQIPTIIVPTLSDYITNNSYPGAICMDIKLEDELFSYMILKHLIINESMQIKEMSTINYQFQKK